MNGRGGVGCAAAPTRWRESGTRPQRATRTRCGLILSVADGDFRAHPGMDAALELVHARRGEHPGRARAAGRHRHQRSALPNDGARAGEIVQYRHDTAAEIPYFGERVNLTADVEGVDGLAGADVELVLLEPPVLRNACRLQFRDELVERRPSILYAGAG